MANFFGKLAGYTPIGLIAGAGGGKKKHKGVDPNQAAGIINEGHSYGLALDVFSPEYTDPAQLAIRKRYATAGELDAAGNFVQDGPAGFGAEQRAAFRALDAYRNGATGVDLPPPPAPSFTAPVDRPAPRPELRSERDNADLAVGDAIKGARDALVQREREISERERQLELAQGNLSASAQSSPRASGSPLGEDVSNWYSPELAAEQGGVLRNTPIGGGDTTPNPPPPTGAAPGGSGIVALIVVGVIVAKLAKVF